MSYTPYPKYKDSGVEWLGAVPEGWENWKLSHAFTIIGSGTTPKSDNALYYDGNIPWVTTSELREGIILETKATVTEFALIEYSALRIFPKGTLLVAMYGATIGRMGLLDIEATCNQACCALTKGLSISSKFLFFWLQCMREVLVAFASGGGQPNLSQEFIKSIIVAAPSMQDQKKIIFFLDQQCGHIDSLIEKKRRMLDLLDEKRRALITQAVTRGLDSSVPMKDSGVEWLGMVPVGWEVGRVAFGYEIVLGKMLQPVPKSEFERTVPYYRAFNVQWENISGDLKEMWATPEEINIFSIREGDLLVCEGGEVGRAAIINYPVGESVIIQNALHRVRAFGGFSVNFLLRILEHAASADWFSVLCNKSTIAHFTGEKFKSLKIPLPPLSEQQAIADYLDTQTAALDKQRKSIETSIELLREYRASLITHAVTGKIDVRNFSPAQ